MLTKWKVYIETTAGAVDVFLCGDRPRENPYNASLEFVPKNGLDAGCKHIVPMSRVNRLVEVAS